MQDNHSDEEMIQVNGNNFVISGLDQNEDLPFHISQALQSAFRGQTFRTIFTSDRENLF